ncbi:MAG TPA: TonB-dependent receptor, partial [Saprospiraceae bacterium]|nr:TonB-dependent receptor [Saprospiraceae bacterium]
VGHRFNNTLRGEYALIWAQYDFHTTNTQEDPTAYEHAYRIGHYEARMDYHQVLTDKNALDYGLDLLLYRLNRGEVTPYGEKSLRRPTDLGQERGVESAVYIADSFDPLKWMNITAGFRFALFTPLGEKTVYQYYEGTARDSRNIRDSLFFKTNSPIRWYTEPDARVSVNLETDEYGSIKLAFNQVHQNLFMLSNTVAVGPDAQWKLADYYIKPSRSNQVSLGLFRVFPKRGFEASIEVYYKQTRNFPDFRDGADFIATPLVETAVLQGTQKAYGVEFFIKRSSHRLEGWLSYTYSRSRVKVDGVHPWEQINQGLMYPSNYDIPHVVNLVATYHFSRRITLSSIVAYQTGRPTTYPVSTYYVDGDPTLDYSTRNAYRIPYYFRTDLSLTL